MSAPTDDEPGHASDQAPPNTASGPAVPEPRTGPRAFLADCWVNCKRWTIKSTRNPFVLVVSLVQPIIFLVLFTQVFGGIAGEAVGRGGADVTYETFLVPAMAIQVSLAAAITSGVGLVNDIETGMFEKVLVTPMNRTAVFLGKTAAELARIVVQVGIILALGVVLGADVATGVPGAIAVVGVCLLFSLWFVAFSNAVAVLTRDQESTIIAANLLQFPLLFLSSAFLPIEALPGWIQTFARFNPVTYGVDAARALVMGRDVMTVLEVTAFGGIWDTLVPAIVVLVALDVAFGGVAVALISRATSSAAR